MNGTELSHDCGVALNSSKCLLFRTGPSVLCSETVSHKFPSQVSRHISPFMSLQPVSYDSI